MVTGSEKNKRQIFNLLTFWLIAGFTLIGHLDVPAPHEDGFLFLNFVTRGLALFVVYSIAATSNRTAFEAMLLTGLAWMTTHILFAGFGDVEGPYLVLAVASTTTLVVNAFYEFDARHAWQAPRWAGAVLLLVAGLVTFEAWETTQEEEPCAVVTCHEHVASRMGDLHVDVVF